MAVFMKADLTSLNLRINFIFFFLSDFEHHTWFITTIHFGYIFLANVAFLFNIIFHICKLN